MMKKSELVFIPSSGLSHLIPTVEAAKLLLGHDCRLSATVLLIPTMPKDTKAEAYVRNISSDPIFTSRLRFINLPYLPHSYTHFFEQFDVQIPNVRDAISDLTKQSTSRIAAVVLDIFCTEFVDVAGEFGLPAYLFFTGGAAGLGLFQHLVTLKFRRAEDVTLYHNAEVELSVPCFSLPLPAKALPAVTVDKQFFPDIFLNHFKRVSEMKGVMINTCYELESYAVEALLSDGETPEIFPVGPILKQDGQIFGKDDEDVKKWLDDQPENSVVFLCFGTLGSFDEIQVGEIAKGLEKSGSRFLWSLRKQGMREKMEFAREYEDFDQVLPEGFLERTKAVGKVIGWAPQAAVLSHAAVGGFVSHCGWSSTLESVWFGVPIATFPLFAEQQMNAFYLVKELGMAEAITLDYQMDLTGKNPPETVGAEEIAAAIGRVMGAEGVRKKVEEMQKKARAAVMEGGSSYNAQTLFIDDVMRNS